MIYIHIDEEKQIEHVEGGGSLLDQLAELCSAIHSMYRNIGMQDRTAASTFFRLLVELLDDRENPIWKEELSAEDANHDA